MNLNDDCHSACCRDSRSLGRAIDVRALGHGRSGTITFGQMNQVIHSAPEVTIGIISHSWPAARDFAAQFSKGHESNKGLKLLLPGELNQHPHDEPPLRSEIVNCSAKPLSTSGVLDAVPIIGQGRTNLQ